MFLIFKWSIFLDRDFLRQYFFKNLCRYSNYHPIIPKLNPNLKTYEYIFFHSKFNDPKISFFMKNVSIDIL